MDTDSSKDTAMYGRYEANGSFSQPAAIGRFQFNEEMRLAFVPLMIIIGIEMLFGIVGNSMVFFVFYTRYKKCNFKYFALFLCATDLAGCITSMPLDIVLRYYYFDVPGRSFCKIKFFFLLSVLLLETFTLLIICVDRFRKICRPLAWQISNTAALRLCAFSFVVAMVATGLVTGIITGMHYEAVTRDNITFLVTQCGTDEKYKNTSVAGISIVVEFIVIIGILVVMVVLYMFVARQLYRTKTAALNRSPTSGSSGEPTGTVYVRANVAPARRKSFIAIALTGVFGVTIALHAAFLFLLASHKLTTNTMTFSEWAVYTIIYTTYLVNYCVNPVIYGCLDNQFSKFLRDVKNRVFGKRNEYSTNAGDESGNVNSKTDGSEC